MMRLRKRLGALLPRGTEDLVGRPVFEDDALVQEAHAVRDLTAKPISCVAITIVMPVSASSRITVSTSPTSSGRARS